MEVLIEKSSNSMVDFPAGHVWTNFWWLLVKLIGIIHLISRHASFAMKTTSKTKQETSQPTRDKNRPFGGPNLLEQEVPCGGQTPLFFPESNMAMRILKSQKKCIEIGNNIFKWKFSVATFDCRRIKNDKNSQNRFLSSWFWNYSNECSVKLSLIVGYIYIV